MRLLVPDQDTSKQSLDRHELLTKVFDPHRSFLLLQLVQRMVDVSLAYRNLSSRSNRLPFVARASTPPGSSDTARCVQIALLNNDVSRQRLLPLLELKINDFYCGHRYRPTGG